MARLSWLGRLRHLKAGEAGATGEGLKNLEDWEGRLGRLGKTWKYRKTEKTHASIKLRPLELEQFPTCSVVTRQILVAVRGILKENVFECNVSFCSSQSNLRGSCTYYSLFNVFRSLQYFPYYIQMLNVFSTERLRLGLSSQRFSQSSIFSLEHSTFSNIASGFFWISYE